MTITAPSNAPARFSDLGVPRALCAVLESQGIESAFPIQAATLPDALAGRDICGKAPTGSGKTLAFGLAVLARISERPKRDRRGPRPPSALILAPTRELALQIESELRPLATSVGAWVTSIYGGVSYTRQLNALRRGVDVVIACPGRLTDLLERRALNLSSIDVVVIDEADRMADMGFLPAVRKLVALTAANRQTLLFSATLDGAVDSLIREFQHEPARHAVDAEIGSSGEVNHHFWRVERDDRISLTADAISQHGPAIVFCRTKHGAERLAERLEKGGVRAAAIHGDRSQRQREQALSSFRAGRVDALVATDVAARGIHVDDVPLVIQFDLPTLGTDYVHRAGRTGRAGADGIVLSMVGHEHTRLALEIQRELALTPGLSTPNVETLTDGEIPEEARWMPSAPAKRSTPAARNSSSSRGRPPKRAHRTHRSDAPTGRDAQRRGRSR